MAKTRRAKTSLAKNGNAEMQYYVETDTAKAAASHWPADLRIRFKTVRFGFKLY
jgi:hypothetical protein